MILESMIVRLLWSLPALASGSGAADTDNPRVDHAIIIAVDGLRSDALMVSPRDLPNFRRLIDEGASTLNARTDPDITVTLPNHLGMVTGRLMLGDQGHHWELNDLTEDGPQILHDARGQYIESIFDVAHDRSLRVAIIAGKTKLHLLKNSWGEERGLEDVIDDDDGRTKIDTYTFDESIGAVASKIIETLGNHDQRNLIFACFRHTDAAGHAEGWDLTEGSLYMRTLIEVDREIGRILDAIEGDDRLRGKVAIILTADHGGGAPFKSHNQQHMWVNYIIPFIVWTGGAESQSLPKRTRDLYTLNPETRRDPGLDQPPHDLPAPALPPIRNSDAANLALDLLGLPPVAGSTVNQSQDLVIVSDARSESPRTSDGRTSR
jgi:hypothetical protein